MLACMSTRRTKADLLEMLENTRKAVTIRVPVLLHAEVVEYVDKHKHDQDPAATSVQDFYEKALEQYLQQLKTPASAKSAPTQSA